MIVYYFLIKEIPRHLLVGADGFLIVYSVDDDYSYQVTQVKLYQSDTFTGLDKKLNNNLSLNNIDNI